MSTNLSQTERIDRTLYTINGNNFKLLNSILLGQKGKDDIRLNPIYVKNYESSKYSDRSELNTISINTSDFLVLNYFEKVDGDFIKEEIFISYPHITSFKEFLSETISDIFDKESAIYKKTSVANDYSDLVYISTPLGGGKKIGVYPVKLATEDNEYYNGVGIILNTEENQAVFETDLNNFFTFVEMVNNIDLMLISNITLLMGLQIMGGGSNSGSESTSSSRKSTIPPRRSVNNPLARRKATTSSNDDEEETDDKPSSKPTSRKITKSSTKDTKKTVSKISKEKLNDILDDDEETEDDESSESFSLQSIVEESSNIEFDDTDLSDGAF